MIDIDKLAKHLKNLDYNFFTAKSSKSNINIYNLLEMRFPLIKGHSTAQIMAMGAGAALAGKRTCLLVDEKSLFSSINILKNVVLAYNLPFLAILVCDDNDKNLEKHMSEDPILQNIKTLQMNEEKPLLEQLAAAKEHIQNTEKPVFIKIKQSQILEMPKKEAKVIPHIHPLYVQKNKGKERPDLRESIESIQKGASNKTVYFSSNPYFTKHLESKNCKLLPIPTEDTKLSAIALGFALSNNSPTILLDTPENFLANLSTASNIGQHSPNNLLHILLENEEQSGIDFTSLAHSLSYNISCNIDSKTDLEKTVKTWHKERRTTFILVRIKDSKENPFIEILKKSPLDQKAEFLDKSDDS